MLGLNDDFRDLLAALSQQGASYLVVGAHARAPRRPGSLDRVAARVLIKNATVYEQAGKVSAAP
jgi:hypothetical protein